MGATGSTPTPSTLDLVSRPARCPETGRPQGVALPGFVWDRKDRTALTLLPVSLVIKLTAQLVSRCDHVLTQQLQIRAGLLPTNLGEVLLLRGYASPRRCR
jgi:hypothetical protein